MKDARGVPMVGAASEPFPSWGVHGGRRRPEGLRGLRLGAVVSMGRASFMMDGGASIMGRRRSEAFGSISPTIARRLETVKGAPLPRPQGVP